MSGGQYTPGTEGQPVQRGNGTPPADRSDKTVQKERRQRDSTPASPAGTPTGEARVSRTGAIWTAVVAALLLLILLIIFILQNQNPVLVSFLGLEGTVPLGVALFIAAGAGGVLVAVAGGARILQLRLNAHRLRATQRK